MVKFIISSFIVSILLISVHTAIDGEIENKNVDRTIDLSSQLVKISYKITLEHKSKKSIGSYTFVLPEIERSKLSFISAKDSSKKELKLTEARSSNGITFTMQLPGSSPNPVVYIDTVFTKSLKPYPTSITQNDKQFVQFTSNAYFFSPFKTLTQKTTVHLSSRNVESFTTVKPTIHSDTTITYGPYENIKGKMLSFPYIF